MSRQHREGQTVQLWRGILMVVLLLVCAGGPGWVNRSLPVVQEVKPGLQDVAACIELSKGGAGGQRRRLRLVSLSTRACRGLEAWHPRVEHIIGGVTNRRQRAPGALPAGHGRRDADGGRAGGGAYGGGRHGDGDRNGRRGGGGPGGSLLGCLFGLRRGLVWLLGAPTLCWSHTLCFSMDLRTQ